jgi:hypothetical protein
MAKKTHVARSTRPTTAARRTQPAAIARPKAVEVESSTTENGKGNGNGDGGKVAEKSATAVIASATPKRTAPPINTRPTAAKSKTPTTPTSSPARAAAAMKAGKTAARAAAQPMLRQRTFIRAENFSYVLKDLRLIAIIAIVMFVFMIVMHFVLPN